MASSGVRTWPARVGAALAPAGVWRAVLLSVLAAWLLSPIALAGAVKQDLVPYLVAGELLGVRDEAVYRPPERAFDDLDPGFRARSCELLGPGTPCAGVAVPAVSPPVVLPLAAGLAHLGAEPAAFLVRLLGAACFAAGMLVLWHDLAPRSRWAPAAVSLTAVALTPFVIEVLAIAQTSPLLFAGACLVPARFRSRAALAAACAVWVLAVGFKGFPLLLVALVLYRRWWRVLAWAAGLAGALLAVTLALVPPGLWLDYGRASAAVSRTVLDVPGVISLPAIAHTVAPGVAAAGGLTAVATLAAVVAGWWRWGRRAGPAVEWAVLWLGAMLVMPLVWRHYLVVALPPVALAVAARRDADRWLPVVPALGVLLGVLGGMDVSQPLTRGVAAGLLVAAFAGALALAAGARDAGVVDRRGRSDDPAAAGAEPTVAAGGAP